MVLINGQDWAVPATDAVLSDATRATLAAHGPYTQDFARIYPILQPDRCHQFMDQLLADTNLLLAPVAQKGFNASAVIDFVRALLSRPNVDPGGPTYTTFLKPLLDCDTKSYDDIIRIVDWAENHIGGVPLVLLLLGDGQSVLRMRDLKRLYPDLYKHVLVANGPFHSGAHLQFACLFLWDKPLLHTCFVAIGKREWNDRDKVWTGVIPPRIKNLEHNSADHTLQGSLAVTVAIYVFLCCHITQPPPSLLLRDPALYTALVENAGVKVLVEYLRHAGLPMLWWQRTCRSADGIRLDHLHALAIHIFRCAHKTSSAQISLLHLISVFGTHPSLRDFVRKRLFHSLLGHIGSCIGSDKSLEIQNEDQKSRNTGHSVLNALHFGRLLQPLNWVNRMWRLATGGLADVDPGYRASIVQEVEVLVALFVRLVATSDARTRTNMNPFWHTGQPRNMNAAGAMRDCRPWDWIWAVATGTSRGWQETKTRTWWGWFRDHITAHMFYQ